MLRPSAFTTGFHRELRAGDATALGQGEGISGSTWAARMHRRRTRLRDSRAARVAPARRPAVRSTERARKCDFPVREAARPGVHENRLPGTIVCYVPGDLTRSIERARAHTDGRAPVRRTG